MNGGSQDQLRQACGRRRWKGARAWAVAVMLACGSTSIGLGATDLEKQFQAPPASAQPWVFWYWMQASVSRAGITADLEAMRAAGIGGAYLMSIKPAAVPPHVEPPVETLTPEWWAMVRHAMTEADRLGLELAMHVGDGFATAGGPWITPELSMQKVVWSETVAAGGATEVRLPQPPALHDYYRDIAVLAYPIAEDRLPSTETRRPRVTSSLTGIDPAKLADPTNTETIRSEEAAWFVYEFEEPFTARSLRVQRGGGNYQGQRLRVEASDEGETYRFVAQLDAPRHGWQDRDVAITHALPPTTARFFRFSWTPDGSEPGAEDLDFAKWRAVLRLQQIQLLAEPHLHQFEGKTGAVWRISPRTTEEQIPQALAVPREQFVDLTGRLEADGRLRWDVPPGHWNVLRIGHTTTGHVNATGGAGKGLEADKFNPVAARLQFDRWFGEAIRRVGPDLARRVLKGFHIDSWEAGSQNWSPVFREEFKRRRGYDVLPYLPLFAGVPIDSVAESERVLHDMRETISQLVLDNFYRPLAALAHAHGCWFSAENIAPTLTTDSLLHFQAVDLPMGEFWLRSPTHDKPNDMRDAVSAAHLYGKPIVQAEAFTQLRMAWDEHPALLKTLGDRNYALGINRFVYHVFTHNPWTDRRPGMTLDGVGLYFQRDQTWWEPGRAWVQYAQRVQALLQQGRPVVDVAVFTGEELPRRAVLPERLVDTLPGVMGPAAVARERERRANRGQPLRELPAGVRASATITDPADWVDPLRGYAYDSINPDALVRLAHAADRRLRLPGGASYRVLVVPGRVVPGLPPAPRSADVEDAIARLRRAGVPVIEGDYAEDNFSKIGVEPDFVARDQDGRRLHDLAWTHRAGDGFDLYFVSNQRDEVREVELSLRVSGRRPEVWDPVTGEMQPAASWAADDRRTQVRWRFAPAQALFLVFQHAAKPGSATLAALPPEPEVRQVLDAPWTVRFAPDHGGPEQPLRFDRLEDWRAREALQHYSGTATYETTFDWSAGTAGSSRVWLDLGRVHDLAEIWINGRRCGIAWTPPYRVEVTDALQPGENRLRIDVTNTWRNRLIGDASRPPEQRVTFTPAPDRWSKEPLLPAGLLGPIRLLTQ